MGDVHVSGGSIGWLASIPVVVAVVLWISVLAGVAAPLGEWLGRTAGAAETPTLVADESGKSAGPELPCVCAAAPITPAR